MRRPDSTPAPGRSVRRLAGVAVRATLAYALCGTWPCSAASQVIRGTLSDVESGRPIPLGLVMMFTEAGDSVTSTITDDAGHFSISSPTPGSFLLLASALGYHETPAGVFDLGADGAMTVEYKLRPRPLPIDALVVSLNRPTSLHHLVRNGFVRRLQRGLGVFITPHDIEESSATSTEDLLTGVTGVRVGPVQGGGPADPNPNVDPAELGSVPRPDVGESVQIRRMDGGWCSPTAYVDGMRVHYNGSAGLTLSHMAALGDVEGIEVYRRPAEVPVEYAAARADVCGVLVVWTKQGLAAGQAGGPVVDEEAGHLPIVDEAGSGPHPGEHVRMELAGAAHPTLWEGAFAAVQGDRLVGRDTVSGRTLAVPLDDIEALQVRRARKPMYAWLRGGAAGAAFGLQMWAMLRILCRSGCDGGWGSAWLPATLGGLFVGALVTSRGPGSRWVRASVPEPTPRSGREGPALSLHVRLKLP